MSESAWVGPLHNLTLKDLQLITTRAIESGVIDPTTFQPVHAKKPRTTKFKENNKIINGLRIIKGSKLDLERSDSGRDSDANIDSDANVDSENDGGHTTDRSDKKNDSESSKDFYSDKSISDEHDNDGLILDDGVSLPEIDSDEVQSPYPKSGSFDEFESPSNRSELDSDKEKSSNRMYSSHNNDISKEDAPREEKPMKAERRTESNIANNDTNVVKNHKKMLPGEMFPNAASQYDDASRRAEDFKKAVVQLKSRQQRCTLEVGKHGHFELIQGLDDPVFLAEGGFGTVVKCHVKKNYRNFYDNHASVAVKRVKICQDVDDWEDTLRLLREAHFLKKIPRHQNLTPLLQVYLDSKSTSELVNYIYLCMPVYNPGSLDEYEIDDLRLIRIIALGLLQGISYLHDHDILHRDVKRENIFYNVHTEEVVLADFGMARSRVNKMTTRRGVGTRCYLGPEQLLGVTDYTSAVDIFAYGCVIFELLGCEHVNSLIPLSIAGSEEHRARLWALCGPGSIPNPTQSSTSNTSVYDIHVEHPLREEKIVRMSRSPDIQEWRTRKWRSIVGKIVRIQQTSEFAKEHTVVGEGNLAHDLENINLNHVSQGSNQTNQASKAVAARTVEPFGSEAIAAGSNANPARVVEPFGSEAIAAGSNTVVAAITTGVKSMNLSATPTMSLLTNPSLNIYPATSTASHVVGCNPKRIVRTGMEDLRGHFRGSETMHPSSEQIPETVSKEIEAVLGLIKKCVRYYPENRVSGRRCLQEELQRGWFQGMEKSVRKNAMDKPALEEMREGKSESKRCKPTGHDAVAYGCIGNTVSAERMVGDTVFEDPVSERFNKGGQYYLDGAHTKQAYEEYDDICQNFGSDAERLEQIQLWLYTLCHDEKSSEESNDETNLVLDETMSSFGDMSLLGENSSSVFLEGITSDMKKIPTPVSDRESPFFGVDKQHSLLDTESEQSLLRNIIESESPMLSNGGSFFENQVGSGSQPSSSLLGNEDQPSLLYGTIENQNAMFETDVDLLSDDGTVFKDDVMCDPQYESCRSELSKDCSEDDEDENVVDEGVIGSEEGSQGNHKPGSDQEEGSQSESDQEEGSQLVGQETPVAVEKRNVFLEDIEKTPMWSEKACMSSLFDVKRPASEDISDIPKRIPRTTKILRPSATKASEAHGRILRPSEAQARIEARIEAQKTTASQHTKTKLGISQSTRASRSLSARSLSRSTRNATSESENESPSSSITSRKGELCIKKPYVNKTPRLLGERASPHDKKTLVRNYSSSTMVHSTLSEPTSGLPMPSSGLSMPSVTPSTSRGGLSALIKDLSVSVLKKRLQPMHSIESMETRTSMDSRRTSDAKSCSSQYSSTTTEQCGKDGLGLADRDLFNANNTLANNNCGTLGLFSDDVEEPKLKKRKVLYRDLNTNKSIDKSMLNTFTNTCASSKSTSRSYPAVADLQKVSRHNLPGMLRRQKSRTSTRPVDESQV